MSQRPILLALLLPLFLAGCSTEPVDQPVPIPTSPPEDGPAPRWFNITLPLHVGPQETREPINRNCIFLTFQDSFQVLSGNVSLIWSPLQPLAEELRLYYRYTLEERVYVAGPSPLTASMQGLDAIAGDGGDWFAFWAQPHALDGSASVEQTPRLTLALAYYSASEPIIHDIDACHTLVTG